MVCSQWFSHFNTSYNHLFKIQAPDSRFLHIIPSFMFLTMVPFEIGHVSSTWRTVYFIFYYERKLGSLVPLDKYDCYNTEILNMFLQTAYYHPLFLQLNIVALFLIINHITCICSWCEFTGIWDTWMQEVHLVPRYWGHLGSLQGDVYWWY